MRGTDARGEPLGPLPHMGPVGFDHQIDRGGLVVVADGRREDDRPKDRHRVVGVGDDADTRIGIERHRRGAIVGNE